MPQAQLYILDYGRLEIDQRFHYPLHNLGERTNKNPDITWEAIPTFSMVLETSGQTIIVDTGSHPRGMDDYWSDDWQDTVPWYHDDDATFESRLEQIGYEPTDVDAVIQTHLHNDHAGGLYCYDGTDVPIYAHQDELEWAFYVANVLEMEERGAYVPSDYDYALNWQVLEKQRGSIIPGVEWIVLPGHSPGIMGLAIECLDDPVFLVGDGAFRRGNIFPEVVQPGANWDHAAWADVAAPRIREIVEDLDPNTIFGHDPDNYNEYSTYDDVEIVGETMFPPNRSRSIDSHHTCD